MKLLDLWLAASFSPEELNRTEGIPFFGPKEFNPYLPWDDPFDTWNDGRGAPMFTFSSLLRQKAKGDFEKNESANPGEQNHVLRYKSNVLRYKTKKKNEKNGNKKKNPDTLG